MNKKYNTYDLSGEFGIGYTFKGEEFWFDKEDYNLIKDYCWYYDVTTGYLRTNTSDRKNIYFHRLVMKPDNENMIVDHKKHPPRNENKIDNRKSNLEIVTHSENQMNMSIRTDNKSGTPGVYWDKNRNKWCVEIKINKEKIYIGRYDNKEDAIKARKDAEVKYFGDRRYSANN